MVAKPTYEELELKIEELERKAFERKHSHEALQASAGFLDTLVSSVSEGVIVYDKKFRYKLWNKFMEKLTGMRAENVLGKIAFDLFPHLYEEGIDKLLERALAGKTVQSDDTPYHVSDTGKFGWVTGLYSPHVDLSGNIVGVVAMIHDISDRKRAEDMLRESEERYRLLLEVSPDPIVLYGIEGKTIYVNPAFEQTFGWSLDELRNNRIDFVPEENRPETKETINRMLQGLKIQLFETRCLTKDGRLLDIQLSSSLIFDRNEKPAGNIVILRDITVQKRAERTLRTAHDELEQRVEERTAELVLINENLQQEIINRQHAEAELKLKIAELNSFMNNVPSMAWLKDTESRFIAVNSEFVSVVGMNPESLINHTCEVCFGKEEAKKFREDDQNVIKSKRRMIIEEKITDSQKNKIWLETIKSPIFDESGKVLGTVGIAHDITKRKRTEELLRKQTHDLNERIKELNCLYGISKIREMPDIAFEEMLQEIVGLIPPSWQYPEITCARIIKEGQEYKTKNFKETVWKQTSNIVVHGKRIGILEICYLEEKPESDEGPFLKEERSLINAIAERLGRVTEHKQTEEALRKAHDELEYRVEDRTRELENKTRSLEEANIALNILLEKRQEDKKEIANNVLTNVQELVAPYFEKIKKKKLDDQQKAILSIIEYNLNEIISPFTRKMSQKYLNLTPTEIEVANLIRYGSNSKEIAELMGLSPQTIYNHRKNIRKKFGL
jgi:PAS domain S-box-containing protein